VRTMLIDDHNLFRQGLRYLLNDLDDSITFLEADSCASALHILSEQPVDLILLDFYMPGTRGFEALDLVKTACSSAAVVVLSSEDSSQIIRNVIEHGASGFIPKSSTSDVLLAALKLILAGGTYLRPSTLKQSDEGGTGEHTGKLQQQARDNILSKLSKRQLETVLKAVQGKANKVIARELDLAEGTVKAHLSAAFRALGVKNRTEAVFLSAKLGLTPQLIESGLDTDHQA